MYLVTELNYFFESSDDFEQVCYNLSMIHFATPAEIDQWDELVSKNPNGGDFFQLAAFAHIKQQRGWTPRYIVTDRAALLALEKHVAGFGKLWYCPQGVGAANAEDTAMILHDLQAFAHAQGVFAVKCEPQLIDTPETRQALLQAGLQRSADVQPTISTIWLDIRPELAVIEARFNSKVRYNIRQARKGEVRCRVMPAEESTYRAFYELFTETANGRFVIRPYEYYRKFWSEYCESGHGFIIFAYDGGQLASADFVMTLGHKASRKDAGSTRRKTTRGIPALLILETIRELKKRGITDYDLCGAPHSAHIKDKSHPLYGVGQFKAGFNDHVTNYAGTYLLPVRPWRAKLWQRFVEKLVRAIYYRLKHQAWY